MDQKNEIREITRDVFFATVIRMKMELWRLVQICAVRVEGGYDMSYSFCRNYEMVTLRLHVKEDEEISSITQVYPCAFLQEKALYSTGVQPEGQLLLLVTWTNSYDEAGRFFVAAHRIE